MASSTISLSLSLPRNLLSVRNPKQPHSFVPRTLRGRRRSTKLSSSLLPIQATATEALPLESTTQDIVSATADDGASTIIQLLLFVAFIGLSILTIGVVYIGVSDFLQKRERDKFEKEEEKNNNTKKKMKKQPKPRDGPRGFGQNKIQDDQFDA